MSLNKKKPPDLPGVSGGKIRAKTRIKQKLKYFFQHEYTILIIGIMIDHFLDHF